MFLTKFDRKMYEEALREEGRDEMLERYEQLARKNQEYANIQQKQARRLKEKGISYEDAREILLEVDEEELARIYGQEAGMI